ncbi:10334_t:CDS:2, partial [Cetraspora pellucida]
MLAETRRIRKELKSTLSEIIESCQDKVVHVDNPPSNQKLRKNSRKKVLEHLQNTCQEDYNPDKLQKLTSLQSLSSQTSDVNFPLKDNQAELTIGEEQIEAKENILIIGKKEREKMIAELQSKKDRLKKEIAEKEKIIRQK